MEWIEHNRVIRLFQRRKIFCVTNFCLNVVVMRSLLRSLFCNANLRDKATYNTVNKNTDRVIDRKRTYLLSRTLFRRHLNVVCLRLCRTLWTNRLLGKFVLVYCLSFIKKKCFLFIGSLRNFQLLRIGSRYTESNSMSIGRYFCTSTTIICFPNFSFQLTSWNYHRGWWNSYPSRSNILPNSPNCRNRRVTTMSEHGSQDDLAPTTTSGYKVRWLR